MIATEIHAALQAAGFKSFLEQAPEEVNPPFVVVSDYISDESALRGDNSDLGRMREAAVGIVEEAAGLGTSALVDNVRATLNTLAIVNAIDTRITTLSRIYDEAGRVVVTTCQVVCFY